MRWHATRFSPRANQILDQAIRTSSSCLLDICIVGPHITQPHSHKQGRSAEAAMPPQSISGVVTKAGVMAKTVTLQVARTLVHPKLLKVRLVWLPNGLAAL